MRPKADAAQAALIRAAAAIVAAVANDRQKPMLVVQELRARDWASITFTGARHELDLAIMGEPDASAEALALLLARLPDAEVPLPGQFLADVSVAAGATPDGFTIAALVIDD